MVCNWRLLPEEGFDAENVTIALCFRFECAQDAERIVEDTTEKALKKMEINRRNGPSSVAELLPPR